MSQTERHGKLAILYLKDFFREKTDQEHPVKTAEILSYMEEQGVPIQRRTFYEMVEELNAYGFDIQKSGGSKNTAYFLADRGFELPELKLLVDSVQSSKFITLKKSESLIRKIEKLGSVYDAQQLHRQVFVQNRIKAMNESIYYNVDEIHAGISANRKIRFHYFDYTVSKEKKYRKDGAFYEVSPYALAWDDENYYMIAYDSVAGHIKHYRVDRMEHISITQNPRDGMDVFSKVDLALYSRRVFGMFGGQAENIRMRFHNRLVGAVLDRIGTDAILIPDGPDHFTVTASVVPSQLFFAWLVGLGTDAQVLGPENVVDQIHQYLLNITALYES